MLKPTMSNVDCQTDLTWVYNEKTQPIRAATNDYLHNRLVADYFSINWIGGANFLYLFIFSIYLK